jgi:hypothetical protein
LLTADEAEQMLRHVLGDALELLDIAERTTAALADDIRDTEFPYLLDDWLRAEPNDAALAAALKLESHINTWGAAQRVAGRQEAWSAECNADGLREENAELRARAEAAEAALGDANTKLVIACEKMLCEALGRSWAPAGMSFESLINDVKAALASRPAVDLAEIAKALKLAMDICDAVPTRAHKSDDTLLALLGRLVNCQDDGSHGYAVIRDALTHVKTIAAPRVITKDNAKQFMEESLWSFIDTAAAFPSISPDDRVWGHVLAYKPKHVPIPEFAMQVRPAVDLSGLHALLETWRSRSTKALPTDAMLINKHIRELSEQFQALLAQGGNAGREQASETSISPVPKGETGGREAAPAPGELPPLPDPVAYSFVTMDSAIHLSFNAPHKYGMEQINKLHSVAQMQAYARQAHADALEEVCKIISNAGIGFAAYGLLDAIRALNKKG